MVLDRQEKLCLILSTVAHIYNFLQCYSLFTDNEMILSSYFFIFTLLYGQLHFSYSKKYRLTTLVVIIFYIIALIIMQNTIIIPILIFIYKINWKYIGGQEIWNRFCISD